MRRKSSWRLLLIVCLGAFSFALATGCPIINVYEGDNTSVENWEYAYERWVQDWALIAGLSEMRELTEADFPIMVGDTALDISWEDYSTTRDGYKTFREYEASKLEPVQ